MRGVGGFFFFSSLTIAAWVNFKTIIPSCFPSLMKGLAEMYPTALEEKTHASGMMLC